MRLILVVPCFNEADRFQLEPWRTWLEQSPGAQLCFVDDGSRDATRAVLQQACSTLADRAFLVGLDHNRGKGEAVRQGLRAALDHQPHLVGFWDADLATPLDEVPRLVAALDRDPTVVGALAARVRLLGNDVRRSAVRHYAGRVFATVASLLTGLPVYDTQCGAKLFRPGEAIDRAIATPFSSRWVFDLQLIARLVAAAGPRSLAEVPVRTWHDVGGSKLRPWHLAGVFRDLFAMQRDLARCRRRIRELQEEGVRGPL